MEKKNDGDYNDYYYYYYFNMCLYEYFAIRESSLSSSSSECTLYARMCVFTMLCWKYEFFAVKIWRKHPTLTPTSLNITTQPTHTSTAHNINMEEREYFMDLRFSFGISASAGSFKYCVYLFDEAEADEILRQIRCSVIFRQIHTRFWVDFNWKRSNPSPFACDFMCRGSAIRIYWREKFSLCKQIR